MVEYVQKNPEEIIATVNNKKVGEISYSLYNCMIYDLFIEYNFRNKKIGTNLLKKAEKEMKNYGCQNVSLISKSLNFNDINPDNFYFRNGYHWSHPILRYFCYESYNMEKKL